METRPFSPRRLRPGNEAICVHTCSVLKNNMNGMLQHVYSACVEFCSLRLSSIQMTVIVHAAYALAQAHTTISCILCTMLFVCSSSASKPAANSCFYEHAGRSIIGRWKYQKYRISTIKRRGYYFISSRNILRLLYIRGRPLITASINFIKLSMNKGAREAHWSAP